MIDVSELKMSDEISHRYFAVMNKLAKWRTVFASRWIGAATKEDTRCISIKDLFEAKLLMRAEYTGLQELLISKGIITADELALAVIDAARHYDEVLEKTFPGFASTEYGLKMDLPTIMREGTTKGWPA